MKSRTKTSLSIEKIARLVESSFGEKTRTGEVKELKGGMFNSAYLVELPDTREKVVLKISYKPDTAVLTYERDIMHTEIEAYQLLAKNTTVPVPKILGYDFSRKLIPNEYFFMSALSGTPMNKVMRKIPPQNLIELKKELAGYFAQIHSIKGKYFGYFTNDPARYFSTWKEAFLDMFNNILEDGRKGQVHLPYERIWKVLQEQAGYLDEVQNPSLVDYDLWAGNIFLINNKSGYHIEGIVDFERSFWGDPFADFTSAMMLIRDIGKEREFWNSYVQKADVKNELTSGDKVRMNLYKMYLAVILMVEVYRYNFIYAAIQRSMAKNLLFKCLAAAEETTPQQEIIID